MEKLTVSYPFSPACNFKCEYCSQGKKNIEKTAFKTAFTFNEFVAFFNKYLLKYEIFLGMTGGEPTIDTNNDFLVNLYDFTANQSNIMNFSYISNLSGDEERYLEIIKRVGKKVSFMFTIHRDFLKEKQFVYQQKAVRLNKILTANGADFQMQEIYKPNENLHNSCCKGHLENDYRLNKNDIIFLSEHLPVYNEKYCDCGIHILENGDIITCWRNYHTSKVGNIQRCEFNPNIKILTNTRQVIYE